MTLSSKDKSDECHKNTATIRARVSAEEDSGQGDAEEKCF